jgi:hypothetical protein
MKKRNKKSQGNIEVVVCLKEGRNKENWTLFSADLRTMTKYLRPSVSQFGHFRRYVK